MAVLAQARATLSPFPVKRMAPAFVLVDEIAEFASSAGTVSKKIFKEPSMRNVPTTLCRGIARQVFASAPLRACISRPVLTGQPVPTDGLTQSFGPALRCDLHLQPRPFSRSIAI